MTIGAFLRILLSLMWKYRSQMIILAITMGFCIAFETFQPLSLKYLVDDALIPHNHRLLVIIIGVLLGAGLLYALATLGQYVLYARFSAVILNDLRLAMFNQLQRLPMGFYHRSQVGDLMSRFSTDLSPVEMAITYALPTVVTSFFGLLLSVGFLFTLEVRLAVLAVVGLLLSYLESLAFAKGTARANYEMKEEQSRLATTLQENLVAQAVVKGFGLRGLVLDEYTRQSHELRRVSVKANTISYLMEVVPSTGILVFNLVIVCVGAYFVSVGSMSVGTLVSFNGLFLTVSSCVGGLTSAAPYLAQGAAGMQRVQEILDEPLTVVDSPDAAPLPPIAREITFKDVTFSYTGETVNLAEASLAVPHGHSAALVGSSGCGKSTILNLVMRFYDPTAGSVSIDGHDLRSVTQDSLREQLGIVFQESFLFNTSIRENIRLGRPDATEEEIERAAHLAGVDDFLEMLPNGFDTLVGERGGKLSGGQRQRVAIARAILRNPAILVLDEATSALDPATEASINKTLAELAKGRTLLSVTHRLAPVVNMDQIFVLDKGRVVEHGHHEELLALGGLYARLWQKQTGFVLSEDGGRAEVSTARLRAIPILEQVDEALLEEIARLFVTEQVAADRVLIEEGDPGDKFYIIVRGRVAVLKTTPAGEQRRLGVLGDGDHFGEIALVRNVPRTATIQALTTCVFLTLQRDHFLNVLGKAPRLREAIEQSILGRTTGLTETVEHEDA